MGTNKRFPIGLQDFGSIITDNYTYIDKTRFIWETTRKGKYYFLSRPRRFGKSLLLSTMKAYFEGKRYLFEGLHIQTLEDKEQNPWQSYPVFYIDLNGEKYEFREELEYLLDNMISNWEDLYGSVESEKTFSRRFRGVIKRAYETTGKKVVVLIDEYDKPLIETLFSKPELNEQYREILKGFYSVLKSSDEYLRFVFLTGVTKFSKLSVFSGLNNLLDISLLKTYSEICGITQGELESVFGDDIHKLANENEMTYKEALTELKKMYNGYNFTKGDLNTLYNPFSILNTLSSLEFNNYWFATGTPSFLIDFLRNTNFQIPMLEKNQNIPESGFNSSRSGIPDPIPILFQAGYLTIKSYDKEFKLYTLGFPNEEVRYALLENLLPEYTALDMSQSGYSVMMFVKDIRAGKVNEFMQRIKSIIAGIPYGNEDKTNTKLREQNYQAAIYLIFALMGQFVKTEIHCSTGRTDCVVETSDHVYIFEFKLSHRFTSEDTINQIVEKNYAEPYRSSGKTITAIGSTFDREHKTIQDWIKKEV